MKKTIIRLAETSSTNDYLLHYRDAEAADIVVATALHQTAGRGQGGNKWEDRAGDNLLFSILVHPAEMPVTRQFVLSMAGALAVKDALDKHADGISLKWPNDVYWQDKKISGTLIETTVAHCRLKNVVIGTGINVNQRSFNIDAPNPVSLFQITGRQTPIDGLLSDIVSAFERYYTMALNGEYAALSARYHGALYRREGLFEYADAAGKFVAAIDRVMDDGHLALVDDKGERRVYGFKEVSFCL